MAWNEATMVVFIALQVGTEPNDTFYFLFLSVSPIILAWNEAIIVFYNFLNFFAIFFEFSITHRVGTKWNDNFCFPSFSAFFNEFWIEMKPQWYFFNFLKFFPIFLEFSITRQVGTEYDDNFYFISFSAFPPLYWLEMEP